MTSTVSLRRLPGACLFTLVVVYCATASGQQPAPPGSQEVHIGVQIRQLDGTPVNYLKAKDFIASAGGRSFQVSVTRPSSKSTGQKAIQTHLLIILPSPPALGGPDLLSEAVGQLDPVWREGWRVAVRTPEGGLTPYVAGEEELREALREFNVAHSTNQEAVDTLKDFAGRRVVMTVSNGDPGTAYTLVKLAAGVQAMLYNVGGNPYDNYSYGDGEIGPTGPLPSYGEHVDGTSAGPAAGGMHVVNNTEIYTAQVNLFVEDVRAERSFGTAVRDARNDARSYYDLRLQVDPGTSSIALGISMDPPYKVTAEAYTPTSNPAPEVVLLPKRH